MNCGAEGTLGCVCGRCEDPHDWLVLGSQPWDHGVATWWDYDWRKIAADAKDSISRQVFTRIAEAIEGKPGPRCGWSSCDCADPPTLTQVQRAIAFGEDI